MVEIEFTPAFEQWWDDLTADEQQSVEFSVELLHAQGVALGHPHTSQIKGSRLGRLREFADPASGARRTGLYAFDPGRTVILLIGGDKGTLGDRWYEYLRAARGADLRRAPQAVGRR